MTMAPPAPTRSFIVGCPRSGTTLVQSLLAGHPAITSFPETHFFARLGAHAPWRRLLGLPQVGTSDRIRALFESFDAPPIAVPAGVVTESQYIDWFVRQLDRLARRREASVWIEKTPIHLEHVDRIERALEAPRFIHVVRAGVDVIASLYAVTHDYPEQWGGPRDIDRCIDRWLRSVELTADYAFDPRHTVVNYERLLESPTANLRRLTSFLGVPYTERMLGNFQSAADEVIRDEEAWKASNRGPLRSAERTKFYERFSEREQDYIVRRLRRADPPWPIR